MSMLFCECRFQFQKGSQLFIRTHDEPLIVATMRVCNPVTYVEITVGPKRARFCGADDNLRLRTCQVRHINCSLPMLMVWRFERHEHVLIAPSGGRYDKCAIYRDGFCVHVHVDIFASRDKSHHTAEFSAEPNIKQKLGGIPVLCVQNLDTTTLVLTCAGMLC